MVLGHPERCWHKAGLDWNCPGTVGDSAETSGTVLVQSGNCLGTVLAQTGTGLEQFGQRWSLSGRCRPGGAVSPCCGRAAPGRAQAERAGRAGRRELPVPRPHTGRAQPRPRLCLSQPGPPRDTGGLARPGPARLGLPGGRAGLLGRPRALRSARPGLAPAAASPRALR